MQYKIWFEIYKIYFQYLANNVATNSSWNFEIWVQNNVSGVEKMRFKKETTLTSCVVVNRCLHFTKQGSVLPKFQLSR